MPPSSSDAASTPTGTVGRGVLSGLSLVVFVASVFGGIRAHNVLGHVIQGLVAGGALYYFGGRVVAWIVTAKTATSADDDALAASDDDVALAPVLAKLESMRVRIAAEIERRVGRLVPLGLAIGVLVWSATQFAKNPGGLFELGTFVVLGVGGGYAWASAALAGQYAAAYKADVLPLLAARFGQLDYRVAIAPSAAVLREQRLFGKFDTLSAEDELFGTYRGIPVSIMELRLTERREKSTRIVFDGILTRITLPRTLSGTTAVIGDGGPLGNLSDIFRGNRVHLEDPEFEAAYQVFSTDQIAARALLTPAFMQRFLTLGQRIGYLKPLALAEGNDLTIALPKMGRDNLFEPPDYSRPAASRAALAKLNGDVAAVLAVTDAIIDLDQSVRHAPGATAV